MFYSLQDTISQEQYKKYLQIVGSLSNLFSDSSTPYLYYRIAEKMFCKAFNSDDLSRGDVSYDAKKDSLGIGLKTFLRNNDRTIQKIAEFNQDLPLYKDLSTNKKIKKISELRNKRIEFTNNTYNIDKSIYHCVIRDEGKFYIYEENTKKIDISSIRNIKTKKSSIYFDDGHYEYIFSLSKSTLMKRFDTKSFEDEFDVNILKDPLEDLFNCFGKNLDNTLLGSKVLDTVYLPLYGENKKVYEKSGLNQWNAQGRVRNPDEIYIPIPKKFYDLKPSFFPGRDIVFSLKLPNKETISAKVCQENGKVLMSNPNKKLGKWLLRDIFKLEEGTLVTNELLNIYGIDSVRIDKISDSEYEINFARTNSFEEFISGFE
ncbi:MAG TPA: NgoFVII family restriction endonuclease [Arcobacter sp.]|jgi:hypothetical protein|nr:NgoFVII family restriction endonuclease [Arcobacter sp.]